MHNLTKIKIFRILLRITYPVGFLVFYPFVRLRKRNKARIYFFFDRYAIGGAQKVHLDILGSVKNEKKIVFFTRFSPNDALKKDFYQFPDTTCMDVHVWCDYLLLRLFSVHYFAMLLNSVDNCRILSANSTFFYDMLPFINKKIPRFELLHNFSHGKKGMEFFGLANHELLDKRLVIDLATQNNIFKQYSEYNIPVSFNERVQVIEFGVDIPPLEEKPALPPLRILYAGRGTYQKRIWLLNKIAEYFIGSAAGIEFIFAGPLDQELSDLVKSHYRVLGEIGDARKMQLLFVESHVVILTSSFEGFPVMIKEAMANGCVPLVTALEGTKTHLTDGENALLMGNPENEEQVVSEAITKIKLLSTSEAILQKLSKEAYDYASLHFRKDEFLLKYKQLLTTGNYL